MSKHTPGPWETYVNTSQGYRLGVLAPGDDGYRAGNECLCEVRDPNGYEGGVPEAEANARLIAAAPDLLESLESLLASSIYADAEGLYAVEDGGCDDSEHRAVVQRCRVAIAKARDEPLPA